ncbi:hypothetical protein FLACOL7796_02796 [Flavobacterium collinsii]|uniref:Uncharacterized protein n=1 Tax=Flavobacterium collinsii TaxID=1114861 RepID=A0ABM8KK22_9FLAO|nr:hypothetical protein FLACOL7796_02796 [Flavobacterium collinsii]
MVFYNFLQSFRNYTAKLKRSKNQKSDIYHVFLFKKDAYESKHSYNFTKAYLIYQNTNKKLHL